MSAKETELIPVVVARERFGYTRNYFLMLAKQGKIEGQKINNRWYINPTSAELFFKENEKRKAERSERVRQERREELRKCSEGHKQNFHNMKGDEVFSYKKPLTALVSLTLVLLLSSIAVKPNHNSLETASVQASEFNAVEQLAVAFYRFFSPNTRQTSQEFTTGSSVGSETYATREPPPTTPHQITHTSLVIAPDEVFTATTVESIQDSFSDEVEISVDPNNPDTGIIIPKFRDREGDAYRFLMVPVNQNTQ